MATCLTLTMCKMMSSVNKINRGGWRPGGFKNRYLGNLQLLFFDILNQFILTVLEQLLRI